MFVADSAGDATRPSDSRLSLLTYELLKGYDTRTTWESKSANIYFQRNMMPRLLSINVGLPRDVAWKGQRVHTAIWKQPVQGRTAVGRLNVDGDGQGDLAGHGGEHRAVMVYQIDAYRYWEGQLGRKDFSFGQFGENFTVDGLPDAEVCIGDRYRIGSGLFEVTQPRCWRNAPALRRNMPLPARSDSR